MSDTPNTPTEQAFPVPLARFLPSLKGTADEIWGRLLKLEHGSEKHTLEEWQAVLAALRNQEV